MTDPPRPPWSLRSVLLLGILLPVLALIAVNAVSLYRQALRAADTAYDRTLLASAKSIGEMLEVSGAGSDARLKATVLIVTHDRQVAGSCARTITLRDGHIVGDERR